MLSAVPLVEVSGMKFADILNKGKGSHKLWKSQKTWKITKKSSMHGKIMEFEKPWIIMENPGIL